MAGSMWVSGEWKGLSFRDAAISVVVGAVVVVFVVGCVALERLRGRR